MTAHAMNGASQIKDDAPQTSKSAPLATDDAPFTRDGVTHAGYSALQTSDHTARDCNGAAQVFFFFSPFNIYSVYEQRQHHTRNKHITRTHVAHIRSHTYK